MDFKSSRREVVRVCKFCGREFKTVFRNLSHCLDCSEISDGKKCEQHAKAVKNRVSVKSVRHLKSHGLREHGVNGI